MVLGRPRFPPTTRRTKNSPARLMFRSSTVTWNKYRWMDSGNFTGIKVTNRLNGVLDYEASAKGLFSVVGCRPFQRAHQRRAVSFGFEPNEETAFTFHQTVCFK